MSRLQQYTAAGTLTGDELLILAQLSTSVTISAATISAQASDNSYNDSGSGFVTAGFEVGDAVRVLGFTGNTANNIVSGVLTSVAAGKMIVGGTDGDVIVDDAAGETVTITRWDTRRLPLDAITGSGLLADLPGFRGIPINSQSGNYTTVAADAGKTILHPSGAGAGDTFTIDSNANVAYDIGTAITFANLDSNAVSIAITSDTMYLAGDGSTGTRTLAQYGVATAVKITSTVWLISGAGLT